MVKVLCMFNGLLALLSFCRIYVKVLTRLL